MELSTTGQTQVAEARQTDAYRAVALRDLPKPSNEPEHSHGGAE